MAGGIDHTSLHRTAKYFMDSGRAATHDDALSLLQSFGLTIYVGQEIGHSMHHQTALLTLVNVARRTFLGGIEVVGLGDEISLTQLAPGRTLAEAVLELGGRIVENARADWPAALIGDATYKQAHTPCWQLTWEGWRGGVTPARDRQRLNERRSMELAPALAAAVCAGEAFAYHAGDHPMAGRRATGLSLWRPGANWIAPDADEPSLAFLPSRLWLIGLGNLGQAFAWLLACLPYRDHSQVELLLQDYDRIADSNDSTSVLSFLEDVGHRKARCVSEWLEERGFTTVLEERRFGEQTRRAPDEPGVALCGVDNALARMSLEKTGFDLVVEAGLGAGPNAFRSISLHCFPGSQTAEHVWSKYVGNPSGDNLEHQPAYQELKRKGMDACGLAQLASRTVGVPFVGVIAATLVIAELLRRLHGGIGLEVFSGSVAALDLVETVASCPRVYSGSFVPADMV